MAAEHQFEGGSVRALVIVRNTVSHDARVLRTASALHAAGLEPLVVGVVSEDERRTREAIEDLPMIRLEPLSPFARVRRRFVKPAPPAATGAPREVQPRSRPWLPPAVVALHRLLTTLDFYRQGIALVRALRPELVHCNDFNTMWIGIAAHLLGSAVVYDSHELWADRNGRREPRWWVLAWEFVFVRAAHRTVTTSPAYAEVLATRYRIDPPVVVRNIPLRSAPPSHAPQDGDSRVITYVGGLMPGRGLEPAIAALAKVPEVRLVAIGPGRPDYRRRLTQFALETGVADRFELREPVPPGQVGEVLAGASAGLVLIEPICLSYRLSLPNKLFEYLSAGLPVVASALPAIEAVVRETGAGVVADPADPGSIARAFAALTEPVRHAELAGAARAAASKLSADRELMTLQRIHAEALQLAGRRAS